MAKYKNKPPLSQRFSNLRQTYWRQLTILLTLAIIVSLFFPGGKSLLYSYKLNDITPDPIISPFNFPILKTEAELKLNLDDALKSVPFIFTRAHEVVDDQIEAVQKFIQIVKDIRQAQSKFSASKDALYRNRFTTLFDSVRTVVQSDSASIAVLMNNLYLNAPFAFGNENWNRVINPDLAQADTLDLDQLEADIIQICRNRWAEGIYDINLSAIISSEVAVSINAEDAPELTDPGTYNDLQQAWTRAKVEVTALFENEQDFRRELGYGMVVKFMEPNLIYDKETTERRQNARIDRVPLNRGIVLKNTHAILSFPDDASRRPNISFFAPTIEATGDVVLRSITFSVDSDGSRLDGRVVSSNNGCTTAISGKLPNRTFYCYRTGCRHECKKGVRIERNSVKTIICEC